MSRPSGQKTNREPATEWEYRMILLKLARHWALMIELFWETGIRTGEALNILKADIEKHGIWVTIEKRSDHPRVFILLSDSLYSRLMNHLRYSRSVRVWPYTASAVSLAIKKAAAEAGLPDTINADSFRRKKAI